METGTYQPSGIIDADPTTATVSAAEQKKLEKAEKALKKKKRQVESLRGLSFTAYKHCNYEICRMGEK